MPQCRPANPRLKLRDDNPLLYLIGDKGGVMRDVSFNRFAAVNSGGVTAGVGPQGPVCSYNGSTGYTDIAKATYINGLAVYSVGVTVTPKLIGGYQCIWGWQGNITGGPKLYIHPSGHLAAYYAGSEHLSAATLIEYSTYNIWLIVNQSGFTFVINGVQDANAYSGSFPTTVGFQLAKDPNGLDQFFAGAVSRISVFPRALTPAEIAREVFTPNWRFETEDEEDLASAGINPAILTYYYRRRRSA